MKYASLAFVILFALGTAKTAIATTRVDAFLTLSEEKVALLTSAEQISSAPQDAEQARQRQQSTSSADGETRIQKERQRDGVIPAPLRNLAFDIDTEDKDGPAFTVFFNYRW